MATEIATDAPAPRPFAITVASLALLILKFLRGHTMNFTRQFGLDIGETAGARALGPEEIRAYRFRCPRVAHGRKSEVRGACSREPIANRSRRAWTAQNVFPSMVATASSLQVLSRGLYIPNRGARQLE